MPKQKRVKPKFSHAFVTKIMGGRYIPKVGDSFYRTCDISKPTWMPRPWDTLFKCVGFDGMFVDGKEPSGKITRFAVMYTFARKTGERV